MVSVLSTCRQYKIIFEVNKHLFIPMSEITTKQWTNYLNKKTGGFSCPICKHTDWQTQQDQNGNVCEVEILDNSFNEELIDKANEIAHSMGMPERKIEHQGASLAHRSILIRCGHCGFIAFFDRSFVARF